MTNGSLGPKGWPLPSHALFPPPWGPDIWTGAGSWISPSSAALLQWMPAGQSPITSPARPLFLKGVTFMDHLTPTLCPPGPLVGGGKELQAGGSILQGYQVSHLPQTSQALCGSGARGDRVELSLS